MAEAPQKALRTFLEGMRQSEAGRHDRAIRTFYLARALFENARCEDEVAVCDFMLGQSYSEAGRTSEARPHLEAALQVFRQNQMVRYESDAQRELGYVLEDGRHYGEAEKAYRRALLLNQASGNKEGTAHCSLKLGHCLLALGRFEEAEEAYRRALRGYAALGTRPIQVAQCYYKLGRALEQQHRWEEAADAYLRGREGFEASGSPLDDFVGMCGLVLGQALSQLGRNEEALDAYRAARPALLSAGQQSAAAACYAKAGESLVELGRTEEAAEEFRGAVETYEHAGQPHERAMAEASCGKTLAMLSKLSDAEAFLLRAEATFASLPAPGSLADCRLELANVWADQGKLSDAHAAYEFAHNHYAQSGSWHELAICDLNFGQLLVKSGQLSAGEKRLAAARSTLEKFGAPIDVVRCDLAHAGALFELQRYDDAREALDRASRSVADLDALLETANLNASQAALLFDFGLHEESAEATARARDAYEDAGIPVMAARCDVNLSLALSELDRYPEAFQRLEAARTVFVDEGLPADAASCNYSLGLLHLEEGALVEAENALHRARATFGELGFPLEAAKCDLAIGNVVLSDGRWEEARNVLRLARDVFDGANMVVAAATCDHNLAFAAWREAVRDTVQHQQATFASMGLANTPALAEMTAQDQEAYVVLLLKGMGEGEGPNTRELLTQALTHAVRALAAIDSHRYLLADPANRAYWTQTAHADTYRLAADLAWLAGKEDLLAELVESARVQGIPFAEEAERGRARPLGVPQQMLTGTESPQRSGTDPDTAGAQADTGSDKLRGLAAAQAQFAKTLPLAAPPAVAVGGRSHLGHAAGNNTRVVHVEDAASAFGGEDAWWWGTWGTRSQLYWSLLGDGSAVGGAVRHDDSLRGLLRRFHAALAIPDSAELAFADGDLARLTYLILARVYGGPLIADPVAADSYRQQLPARLPENLRELHGPPLPELSSERHLAWELGSRLIPEPLREELLRRIEAGEPPLRLVVAPSPDLGRIPVGLLALQPPGRGQAHPDAPRLMEGAIVTYAPSAAFIDAVADRPSPPPDAHRRLLMSISDPQGDLPHARTVPDEVRAKLGSWHMLDEGLVDRPATGPAIRGALEEVASDGLLVGVLSYQGHITMPERDPSDAALALAPARPGRCLTCGNSVSPATTCGPGHITDAAADPRAVDRITAHELLTQGNALPRWPTRVLLSGCDSLGAGSSAEWIGLTPALIWAGARGVIATLWPTVDDPVTRDLDLACIRLLKSANDPASALRSLQLEYLHRWRSGTGPGPYFWAAHAYAGMFRG